MRREERRSSLLILHAAGLSPLLSALFTPNTPHFHQRNCHSCILVSCALFCGWTKTAALTSTPAPTSAWAEVCAHFNGHYPYPLLDVLSPPARGALYIGCAAVFVAVLELVQRLHSRLDKAWERSWSALDGQLGKGVTGKIDHKKHIG